MGQDAECYQKTVDDRVIILNVRAGYIHPFLAGAWTDLRCGFFLSLTDAVNDDLTTGLAETISDAGRGLPPQEHYAIGVGHAAGASSMFIGFINRTGTGPNYKGHSMLVSSDAGLGTTNTNFWRPKNGDNDRYAAAIFDGSRQIGVGPMNVQQHFPQDAPTVAAGYAVLLALQLLRPDPNSRTITVRIKSSGNSGDMLYSNTPTKELIHQTMENWPPSQQMGPVTLSAVPDAFYFYWPFHKSRLRVHSLGLLRAA